MDYIKKQLGNAALNYVKEKSIVGLGTGTTAEFFINSLGKKCEEGFSIKAVASSVKSHNLAKKLKIPLIDLDMVDNIDVYIDGADEVDENKNMIKGKGGALLREKILAASSSKVIIMIDHNKYVKKLGKAFLPVEVTPFGANLTKKKLQKLNYFSELRQNENSDLFITENNNYILDIKLASLIQDPNEMEVLIKSIPGIVETGLFIDIADIILLGKQDGKIDLIS